MANKFSFKSGKSLRGFGLVAASLMMIAVGCSASPSPDENQPFEVKLPTESIKPADSWIPLGADFLQDGTLIWVFRLVTPNGALGFGVAGPTTEAAAWAFLSSEEAMAGAGAGARLYALGPAITQAATTTTLATETGVVTVSGTAVFLSAAAVVGTAVAVAIPATLAIDTYMNNGVPVWTTIAKAGGYKILLGYDSSANVNVPFMTVACNSPDITAACTIPAGIAQTGYYSWALGGYWRCGDMTKDGTTNGDALWNQWLDWCKGTLSACVVNTQNACKPQCTPKGTPVSAKACSWGSPPCCDANGKPGGKCSGPSTC